MNDTTITARPGDLIDAGCYGHLYVVLVVSGGYWVSHDASDVRTESGRFLDKRFVRRVIRQA